MMKLSEADKEIYENTFEDENGKASGAIKFGCINTGFLTKIPLKKIFMS